MQSGHRRVEIEHLEPRRLYANVSIQSPGPPYVTDVYMSGSSWSQAFRDELVRETDFNSSVYGALIWDGDVSTVPSWINLDQISVRFAGDVVADVNDLRVAGVNVADYPVASVRSEIDHTGHCVVTWVLTGAGLSRADRLLITIDGGPNGVRWRDEPIALDGDRDGVPGGDFVHRQPILPAGGGTYFSRKVGAADLRSVRYRQPAAIGSMDYDTARDSNGDGEINVIDLANVRRRMLTQLPVTEPSLAATAIRSPLRTRPPIRDLFSSAPVLA